MLRSPHAHARIKSIDTSRAEAYPGVKAVVTAKDLPGAADAIVDLGEGTVSLKHLQDNVLASDKALYKGHQVAAVAAMMLVSTWLLWNRSDDDKSSHPKQNAVRTIDAGQPVVLDQSMPSLLAFGKAMNDSQIDLNDILDQHARTLLPRVPDPFSPVSRWQ